MSTRLSILGPSNVVQLTKPSSQSPTSRLTSSQSRATPLSRGTKSPRHDVVTSPRRLSMTSPVYIGDPPTQPEVVLLCSGQSCLPLPVDTGSRPNGSDVSFSMRGADVTSVGWRVRWRPLDVSEYVVSDFGFRRQLLSESIGMTQQKSIHSKGELERDMVSTTRKHISACQHPAAVNATSRAASNLADFKETLQAAAGYHWTEAPTTVCRSSMEEGNGREWQRERALRRRRMRSNSMVSGGSGEDRSSRKRTGLCRGLVCVKNSSSSNYSSGIFLSHPRYYSDHSIGA